MTEITVLLATWQGARFLDGQLQSLRDQTEPPFTVLARDDASTDDTRRILERWAERHPGWLRILPDDGKRLGASGNFAALLATCPSPYALLCDQDDQWHPDKVARSWALMQTLAQRYGRELPLLVHGDARLIDAQSRPLPGTLASALHHQLEHAAQPAREVMHNYVTGCTAMLNRALIDLASPIPEAAVLHDWWIGLLASLCGKVACVPGTLLNYRQHGENAVGAGTMRWAALRQRYPDLATVRSRMARVAAQAEAALERGGSRLGSREAALLRACRQLPRHGWIARRATLVSHGLWMPGILRNVALLGCI